MQRVVIYGPAQSSYVRSARMTAEEKGIAYDLVSMGEGDEVRWGNEAHLALHPFGKVPALRAGDITLFETSAICRYLDESAGGAALQPADAAGRARMEQWISAINSYLYPDAIKTYAFAYFFPKGDDGGPDRKVIDEVLPKLRTAVNALDRAYGEHTYLAGHGVSLADLFLAPILSYLGALPEGGELIANADNLARAKADLEARESFKATEPPSGD
jgi:glutathione S-transferase